MSTKRCHESGDKHGLLQFFAGCLLLAWASLSWSPAHATTEAEADRARAPMPHESLGAGKSSVKVHWTRLTGYLEGAHGHAAMLNDLQAAVHSCVQIAQRAGRPVRPPKAWPDYVNSTQQDTYAAVNRTIMYNTTLAYTINVSDCSLIETRGSTATLSSAKGGCNIDLVQRKANGFCDRRAHGDAAPMVRGGGSMPDSRALAGNALNPAVLAALQKAMQLMPAKTGEHKTIVGLECDVWKGGLDAGATSCLSRGGSFIASYAAPGPTGSSMELELTSVIGVNMHAVKAQLDTTVNAAVFAPYLADGFEVTDFGGRK